MVQVGRNRLPTHNLNHHKLVNRRGDATITWRYTNAHNVWGAGSYFFVSERRFEGSARAGLRSRRIRVDPAREFSSEGREIPAVLRDRL